MAAIMAPGKLVTTRNVADNWKVWEQMWKNYVVIAQLEMESKCFSIVSVSMR